MTDPGNGQEEQQDETQRDAGPAPAAPVQGAAQVRAPEPGSATVFSPQSTGVVRMRTRMGPTEERILREAALERLHPTRRPNRVPVVQPSNEWLGDITELPIEKVVEELVARGFHAGVISRMSEWYNRALLSRCYREKLRR